MRTVSSDRELKARNVRALLEDTEHLVFETRK